MLSRATQMGSRVTPFAALAASFLLISPASAFDAPLSPEAVRDAYFLGQHNNQSTLSLFSQYVMSSTRPTPKSSKPPAAAPAATAPSKPHSTIATTTISSTSA